MVVTWRKCGICFKKIVFESLSHIKFREKILILSATIRKRNGIRQRSEQYTAGEN